MVTGMSSPVSRYFQNIWMSKFLISSWDAVRELNLYSADGSYNIKSRHPSAFAFAKSHTVSVMMGWNAALLGAVCVEPNEFRDWIAPVYSFLTGIRVLVKTKDAIGDQREPVEQ